MIDEKLLKRAVFYGAGIDNLLLSYMPLRSAGYSALFAVDSDTKKQGTVFYGLEITSPERLLELDKSAEDYMIVITARTPGTVSSITRHIEGMGLSHAHIYTFEEYIAQAEFNHSIKKICCFTVHLVDECNLNCVRCSNLAPLAKHGAFYLSEEGFDADCKKLSELTDGDIDEIQLLGGEPMLHPSAHRFFYIARKHFKESRIVMVSNGTLIGKMSGEFWQSFIDTKSILRITRYPVSLPYDDLIKGVEEKGIEVEYGNTTDILGKTNEKTMWGFALDLNGGLDKHKTFSECMCYGQYVMRDGRLYTCAMCSHTDLLNDHFGLSLPGPSLNGADFRHAKTLKDVTDALSEPDPLCDYCNSKNMQPPVPWSISKKDLREWISKTEGE